MKKTGKEENDNVISRIIEVERQCADAVEKAERNYRREIALYKQVLEEKKKNELERISAAEKARLLRAIEEKKEQIEIISKELAHTIDKLLEDASLNEAVKEKIVTMVLSS
jgi:hypothetical protein